MSRIRSAIERAKTARGGQDWSDPSLQKGQDGIIPSQPSMAAPSQLLSVANVRDVGIDEEMVRASKILTHDDDARHPAEGAYRMLRTRVMRTMRSNGWQVLGVSSIGQNEGKSFTAINLAISIAAEIDQEAVLVDLDLRRPSVYEYLGVDAEEFMDLKEYLEDDTHYLEDLLVCPEVERLACILSAESLERPSDVLASPRGKMFFSELRERLAPSVVVVVDLPPLLAADDALAVAPMLDAFVLVVGEGQAERSDVADLQPLLEEFNHIGTVLNKSVEKDSRRASYY